MRRIIIILNVLAVIMLSSCGRRNHAKHDRKQHDTYSNRYPGKQDHHHDY